MLALSTQQVFELARYVEQKSPELLLQLPVPTLPPSSGREERRATALLLLLAALVLVGAPALSDERLPPLPLRTEIAPRALAGIFCVLLLAAVSSLVALVLAYVLAHGFTPFAFERYTRLVGQVFNPVVSLVFVLKTGALALAVSVVPIGAALHAREAGLAGLELQGLVRMFMVVLAIEVAGLAGNHF